MPVMYSVRLLGSTALELSLTGRSRMSNCSTTVELRTAEMDIRLIWLAPGAFAIGAEGFVISTLLPSISADTGVTLPQAGYLVLAYAVAYAISAPVLATLTGTAGRRNGLVGGALVFSAGARGG